MAAFEHIDDPDWANIDRPVLIAGDAQDIPTIIEVCRVDVPEGVSVRWLVRDDGIRAAERGERLGAAVHGWCVEWACAEPDVRWTVWLGAHTPPHVAKAARSLLGVNAPPS